MDTTMDIVIAAARKLETSCTMVFKLAYEYAENRCPKKVIVRAYEEWRRNKTIPFDVKVIALTF